MIFSKKLVLIDGYISPQRHSLALAWTRCLRAQYFKGTSVTRPEVYAQYMKSALDGIGPVVIECSWHQQICGYSITSPEMQAVYTVRRAKYRMLDRLALACDAPIIFNSDPEFPLPEVIEAWENYHTPLMVFRDLQPPLTDIRLHSTNRGPGIGQWALGTVLIVGDQHGSTKQPYEIDRNIAFCSMSGIGCSEWLSRRLDEYGISESRLYWINARDHNDRLTDSGFIEDLRPLHIIALGDEAAKWCVRAKVTYTKFPHPQYWKRFYSKEEYPLMPMLRKLTSNIDQKCVHSELLSV